MTWPFDPDARVRFVDLLEREYGLPGRLGVALLGDGPDNLVLRVDAGDRAYVARFSRRHRGEDVAFEHDALDHLARAGQPVPRVVRTRAGRRLALTACGPLTLFDHLPGAPLDGPVDRVHARAAGRLLGDLHRAGAGFVSRHQRFRDAWTELHRIDRLAPRLRARWPDADVLVTAARELIEQTRGVAARPGLCHGDFRPGNVLFAGTVPTAVVDWDWCCWSPTASDLALGLVEWSFPDGAPAPDLDLFAAFLAGYRAAGHDVDARAVQAWLLAACVSSAGTFLCDGLDTDLDVASVDESYMFRKYRYFRDDPRTVAGLLS